MNRIKSFDATGIAPNGRLYAGDLNLLQDLVAALIDYAQNIGTGTLAIGDSSLVLSKFGVGEIQISAALRTLGILRAAGGLISGAYTTTTRNAIPAGSRPYGLVILNTTTNQYEWNIGTDAVPNWISISGIDFLEGTFAARPAATTVRAGTSYHATDVFATYRSNGASWSLVGQHVDGSSNFAIGGNFRPEFGGWRVLRTPYVNERHIESGTISVSLNAFSTVSFLRPFATTPRVVATMEVGDPASPGGHVINAVSPTGFQISQNFGVVETMHWIAEGQD